MTMRKMVKLFLVPFPLLMSSISRFKMRRLQCQRMTLAIGMRISMQSVLHGWMSYQAQDSFPSHEMIDLLFRPFALLNIRYED